METTEGLRASGQGQSPKALEHGSYQRRKEGVATGVSSGQEQRQEVEPGLLGKLCGQRGRGRSRLCSNPCPVVHWGCH